MRADAANEAMSVRRSNEHPTTGFKDARKLSQACCRIVDVFDDVVVENRIKTTVFKREFTNAGDLVFQIGPVLISRVHEVVDIDGMNFGVENFLNECCFVSGSAASDEYSAVLAGEFAVELLNTLAEKFRPSVALNFSFYWLGNGNVHGDSLIYDEVR